jgi:hypothetical protein
MPHIRIIRVLHHGFTLQQLPQAFLKKTSTHSFHPYSLSSLYPFAANRVSPDGPHNTAHCCSTHLCGGSWRWHHVIDVGDTYE